MDTFSLVHWEQAERGLNLRCCSVRPSAAPPATETPLQEAATVEQIHALTFLHGVAISLFRPFPGATAGPPACSHDLK